MAIVFTLSQEKVFPNVSQKETKFFRKPASNNNKKGSTSYGVRKGEEVVAPQLFNTEIINFVPSLVHSSFSDLFSVFRKTYGKINLRNLSIRRCS